MKINKYLVSAFSALMLIALSACSTEEFNEPATTPETGTEPVEIKDFGTVRMPLVEILYHRYETMKFTLCTTNEDDQSLKVKYGERIADRMNEMFNRLAFGAQSFRK